MVEPAHPQIVANGKAARDARKQVVKPNVHESKNLYSRHHTAQHGLVHVKHGTKNGTSSGAINRG